jgi:hypothetical protein
LQWHGCQPAGKGPGTLANFAVAGRAGPGQCTAEAVGRNLGFVEINVNIIVDNIVDDSGKHLAAASPCGAAAVAPAYPRSNGSSSAFAKLISCMHANRGKAKRRTGTPRGAGCQRRSENDKFSFEINDLQ